MNSYEQKKVARLERLERAAKLCRKQAEQSHESAHKMAKIIPFGQPILIGHHSEKRDRAYRARISRRFEKSFELLKKAEYYERRLTSALSNNAISSDDPEAVVLLKEKIKKLTDFQEKSKIINKILRKQGTKEEKIKIISESLQELKPETIEKLFIPDCFGNIGIADFDLRNNNAKIRQAKQRLEQLQKMSNQKTKELNINGVKVVDNVEENRLQLFFDGKPCETVRSQLKSSGFRWSHYNGCWQRMRSNGANYQANRILNNI